MRRNKVNIVMVGLVLLVFMLTSCSAKGDYNYNMPATENKYSGDNSVAEDMGEGDMPAEAGGSNGEQEVAQSDANTNTVVNTKQKLIKTYSIDMETQDYDKLIPAIQKKVVTLEGYVESSNLEGKGIYGSNTRYASIVARVPQEKVEEFVHSVSDLGNVVNSNNNTQDITLAYADVESHQKSLRIEQERLLTLLEKAEKLEDIITLEERLSKVRYEIEAYESKLRLFDNQVNYSTVTLNISEVRRITVIEEDTAFDRMKSGFLNSIYNIRDGAVNLFVWIVVNIPYLVIWAIIIIIIVIIVKKTMKKNKKRLEAPKIDKNNTKE